MCGIAGCVTGTGPRLEWSRVADSVREMTSVLRHRGPDDAGLWEQRELGVCFGHQRLSVIDTSPEGHQPMTSASGRFVVTYNGEIYNFRELREELGETSVSWRGGSDTEVLLGAFDKWGVEQTLTRLIGMFSFAVMDLSERRIYLVRDRVGIKPLYYAVSGGALLFASELRSFERWPGFERHVDESAASLFFRHGYVPVPFSMYRDAFKLEPGQLLTVDVDNPISFEKKRYWSVDRVDRGDVQSESVWIDSLESILTDSVKRRMVADVPLGAFLSGGIDSSLVVATMQSLSEQPVHTFSIGFEDSNYDESGFAREVAASLGTEHTELIAEDQAVLDVIPSIASIYDEPFADSSQIPTFLVSRLARQNVTVSLSGDGGDELFGGYVRYLWAPRVLQRSRYLGRTGRRLAARALSSSSPGLVRRLGSVAGGVFPSLQQSQYAEKAVKLATVITKENACDIYKELVSPWKGLPSPLLEQQYVPYALNSQNFEQPGRSFEERMMRMDFLTYLPDDILVKVDRASMAVNLEVRVPLLDHRIVEMAARMPLSLKIRNGTGKWVLRELLKKHIPTELINRPKMGFASPIGQWLKGPLREWASDLLSPDSIRDQGFLRDDMVTSLWSEHLQNRRNWQEPLWTVLAFQAWLRNTNAARA